MLVEIRINGIRYNQYLDLDLPGHDLSSTNVNSLEDCSKHCETEYPDFKSIEYCSFPVWKGMNCFCKHRTTHDEDDLTGLINCAFYHKII